jgi:phospholipid transport system substrate-binding protein
MRSEARRGVRRRAGWAAFVAAGALLCWGPLHAEEAPTGGDAQQVIEQTVAEVLGILRDEAKSGAGRREELEAIAQQRFDFRIMSRLVLARNWKLLSKEERSEFVDEFTEYLANDYGSRIERYEQEEVAVLGVQPEPRGDVTVKTKIVGGDNDGALVDYRMRKRDEEWKIIDVVIEGISLVANFRDQFRDVMGREGPSALLGKLREKNARESAPADA